MNNDPSNMYRVYCACAAPFNSLKSPARTGRLSMVIPNFLARALASVGVGT